MLYATENYLEKLNQFKFKADHKLFCFDAQSLFTNVLQMTLFKLWRILFIRMTIAQNTKPYKLKKNFFTKLLRLANQGRFLYKDKLFQQHDGVSMRSPLAPTIANFVLSFLEKKY